MAPSRFGTALLIAFTHMTKDGNNMQQKADPQGPESPVHSLRDFVKVYESVLSEAACRDIIERFEKDAGNHLRRTRRNVRAFTELNIDHLPAWRSTLTELEQTADECLKRYQADCPGMFCPSHEFESFRIKRYEPGKGEVFARHVDGYDEITALRYVVLFWYLNDVEEGGETWFPELRMRVRPRRGRCLMFPPFWMFEHAGLKPVSSAKFILGTYFTFPVHRE